MESNIFVFDRNLNNIRTLNYQRECVTFTSWLAFGGKNDGFGVFTSNLPANLYKPDIKQFSKELVQVLKK